MPVEMSGGLIALSVAALFAVGSVLARVGLQSLPSGTATLVSLVAGLIVVASLALILFRESLLTLPLVSYAWFLLAGTINFPIARSLNFRSVKLLGVARATSIHASAPLVAATIAILFLGENMTLPIALGTLAIMGGVVLIVTEEA